jgi:hypothetical protein
MVSSKAATPTAYLAELAPKRAELIGRVRDLVNANLPPGYVERMSCGMIGWELPLETYPNTYNGQPLVFAGLAGQKNHNALYLNFVYASQERAERLRKAYAAAGKTLDMGKSCIRFRKEEELAEEALADAIRSTPVEAFIAEHKAGRAR